MLKIIEHPFIQHYLTKLRQRETPVMEFRRALGKIGLFLFYEAARGLTLRKVEVTTPLEKIEGAAVAGKIHLIGILRAALGMIEGIVDHVPNVDVGHIGIYRDEDTLAPHRYYSRLPKFESGEPVFVIDPMLATGGSMVTAIDIVKKAGAENISALTLIAAPEGVDFVHRRYPNFPIYTAALDRELNAQGYILPGLGDAGDRQFGTS
jgi:uracil phosphoribosyltransferase